MNHGNAIGRALVLALASPSRSADVSHEIAPPVRCGAVHAERLRRCGRG